ncbi:helix-turn-helix domain-containing protein [Mesorhizobium sp. M1A.F.Ca.ET.072.01.1.1]|uniref:helix-turn-helix domain-containing protein n=1 Tax=Mesorhizobium sp. M1A.F.Ca.ET.072.01.1.1 TaxID=2496753 RepID=UPI001FE22993|nr:helix-turn-helix domain-containing protein [Mesorhizobium sp. M1A.F.Ca.ET.072.01.1.1]
MIKGDAASSIGRLLTLTDLIFAALAVSQTVATWRDDLVDGRRRLRGAVLIGTMAYIGANAAANFSSVVFLALTSPVGNFSRALVLSLLAALSGWSVFRAAEIDSAPLPAPLPTSSGRNSPTSTKNDKGLRIEPVLLSCLERLMTVERAYRREGLTIGALATLMRVPEYRLRQIINEGLGHRNFNAFLNRYRIEEAKTALADSSQKDVPVLTIAMDAGFQSLGPFNRAFKADTGLTPTEFRRAAFDRALAQ